MITTDGYNIYYNTSHLLVPKPKTYREVVNRLLPLECTLFYNIISSPTCRYERKFADGRIKEHYKKMEPEERFKNIFLEKVIYANPKGYFVNKLNILPRECDAITSVSFALCDYRQLPQHFDARGSEFGICFFHDFLQNKGIRPVVYLNENDHDTSKRLVFNSPHLIEVYSNNYDMRWENEWRIGNDLHFTSNEIAFVIVPQDRHNYFVDWFSDQEGFENVQVLTSNTYKSYVDHLIFYPQQTDNNWNQVEIFRGSDGERGMKIDPDWFNEIPIELKIKFEKKFNKDLSCFSKNTILLNYEYGYTNRFLRFAEKVKDFHHLRLFQDYDMIKANLKEPDEAQRDFILGLFGELWNFYPDT